MIDHFEALCRGPYTCFDKSHSNNGECVLTSLQQRLSSLGHGERSSDHVQSAAVRSYDNIRVPNLNTATLTQGIHIDILIHNPESGLLECLCFMKWTTTCQPSWVITNVPPNAEAYHHSVHQVPNVASRLFDHILSQNFSHDQAFD